MLSRCLIAAALVAAFLMPAHAALPWSCEQIRWASTQLGERQMWRMAREHRLTRAQIAEARACLKDN